MERLNDLLKKCYKNKLDFYLLSGRTSSIAIYDMIESKKRITGGIVQGSSKSIVSDNLDRMNIEVDEHLLNKHTKFIDELIEEVGEWNAQNQSQK